MKTINLASDNPEPYLACPHCLTDVTTREAHLTTEATANLDEEAMHPQIPQTSEEERSAPTSTKPQCAHHFGYLSERAGKDKIPEECITCTEIVDCMLKTVKAEQSTGS